MSDSTAWALDGAVSRLKRILQRKQMEADAAKMEDRTVLRLALGFVATFYGRHFTYIILYAQVLRGRHTAFFSRLHL